MQVQDNLYVERVNVLITDENGQLVETGSATREVDSEWWQYVTTIEYRGEIAMVIVTGKDLAGNEDRLEVSKDVI